MALSPELTRGRRGARGIKHRALCRARPGTGLVSKARPVSTANSHHHVPGLPQPRPSCIAQHHVAAQLEVARVECPGPPSPTHSGLLPPHPAVPLLSLKAPASGMTHLPPFPRPVPTRGRPTFFLKQSGLLSRKSTTVSTLCCPSCSATTDTWLLSPPSLPHAALYVLLTAPTKPPSVSLIKFPSNLTSSKKSVGFALVASGDAVISSLGEPLTWAQPLFTL